MKNLFFRNTVVNNRKIIITFFIASFFSLLILKMHLFSIGIILVVSLAVSIFLSPRFYILFWLIVAAVSNKVVIPGYQITSYGVMNLLFLPILTLKVFHDYRKEFSQHPVWKPYLLFLLLLFISIWYSPESYLMGFRKYCNFIIPFLFSILMVNVIKDYTVLKLYLKITLISVAIMGIIGTVMFFVNKWVVYLGVPRAIGVLGWPNDYALFLNTNLAVALSLAILLKSRKEKILYSFLGLILVCSVIPTFSKGGYIGTLSVFLSVSFFSSLKRRSILPFVSLLLTLVFIVGFTLNKYSDIIFYRLRHHESFHSRITIWESVIQKFWEHPIIGNGFRSSFNMVGYLSPYKDLTSTHSLFLRLLLEIGIIGTAAFFIAYFSMFRYALKSLFHTQKKYTNILAVGFLSLFISAFTYSFVGNAFLTPVINLYFWFYFSFLICFCKLENKKIKIIAEIKKQD